MIETRCVSSNSYYLHPQFEITSVNFVAPEDIITTLIYRRNSLAWNEFVTLAMLVNFDSVSSHCVVSHNVRDKWRWIPLKCLTYFGLNVASLNVQLCTSLVRSHEIHLGGCWSLSHLSLLSGCVFTNFSLFFLIINLFVADFFQRLNFIQQFYKMKLHEMLRVTIFILYERWIIKISKNNLSFHSNMKKWNE